MTQEEVLQIVIATLEKNNIPYMLTGAIAVNYYGRPRLTHDVDIVVNIEKKHIESIVDAFYQEFYLSSEGIEDAIKHHTVFNIIHHETGLKIDFWMLRDEEYDKTRFSRRESQTIFDREMYISSAEDMILVKLLWYKESTSEKHIMDVKGILQVQGESVDNNYLEKWAEKLNVREILKELYKTIDFPENNQRNRRYSSGPQS